MNGLGERCWTFKDQAFQRIIVSKPVHVLLYHQGFENRRLYTLECARRKNPNNSQNLLEFRLDLEFVERISPLTPLASLLTRHDLSTY